MNLVLSYLFKKWEPPHRQVERFENLLQYALLVPDVVDRCEQLTSLLEEVKRECKDRERDLEKLPELSARTDRTTKFLVLIGAAVGLAGIAITGLAGAPAFVVAGAAAATGGIGISAVSGLARVALDGRFADAGARLLASIEVLRRAGGAISKERQGILETASVSAFCESPHFGAFLQNNPDAPERLRDAFAKAQSARIRLESTTLQRPIRILKPVQVKPRAQDNA